MAPINMMINNHVRIFLTSLCFVLALLASSASFANDPIFTVEDVQVDVTAENAIAAREKAFAEAQVTAFTELTTRMLPDADLATTKIPEANIISTMIKDFELTDEKLSSVRYIGTYTFRFKDRDVRRYFAQKGATISDVSSKKLLILPFISRDNRTSIWAPGNPWMQAWNRVPSLSGLVPLEVPLGDLDDVRDVTDSNAFNYEPNRLQNMLRRYNSQEAVITIATPDEELSKIIDPLAIARGKLNVEIFRTDRGQPELVQQVSSIADGAMTRQQLYDRAVTNVRSALQKDWKARTAVAPTPATSVVRAIVPINSLNEWMNIQSALNRVSSLEDVTLKALTPKQVAYAIEVSESSVKRWCDRGLIASVRTAGGHRRIPLDRLVDFVRQGRYRLANPEAVGLPAAKSTTTTRDYRDKRSR